MSYYQVIKDTQKAARKVARETGKPASERMSDIYVNRHGTWATQRILMPRGYRHDLYFWTGDSWLHVANQGRRKTCIELADANYRGAAR